MSRHASPPSRACARPVISARISASTASAPSFVSAVLRRSVVDEPPNAAPLPPPPLARRAPPTAPWATRRLRAVTRPTRRPPPTTTTETAPTLRTTTMTTLLPLSTRPGRSRCRTWCAPRPAWRRRHSPPRTIPSSRLSLRRRFTPRPPAARRRRSA